MAYIHRNNYRIPQNGQNIVLVLSERFRTRCWQIRNLLTPVFILFVRRFTFIYDSPHHGQIARNATSANERPLVSKYWSGQIYRSSFIHSGFLVPVRYTDSDLMVTSASPITTPTLVQALWILLMRRLRWDWDMMNPPFRARKVKIF